MIFERRRAQRRCLEIYIEVLLSWAKYDVTHAQERLSETWQKRASGLSCMPPSEFLKRKSEGPTVCQEPSNSDHPDSEDLAEHGRPSTKTPKRLQPQTKGSTGPHLTKLINKLQRDPAYLPANYSRP